MTTFKRGDRVRNTDNGQTGTVLSAHRCTTPDCYEIDLGGGTIGYLSASHLQKEPAMTTQDEALKQVEYMIGDCATAASDAIAITDQFYLVPRDELPETGVGADGYVYAGIHSWGLDTRPSYVRERAIACLAIADRLEVEQAKTAEVEQVKKKYAWKRKAGFDPAEALTDAEKYFIDRLIKAGIDPEEGK